MLIAEIAGFIYIIALSVFMANGGDTKVSIFPHKTTESTLLKELDEKKPTPEVKSHEDSSKEPSKNDLAKNQCRAKNETGCMDNKTKDNKTDLVLESRNSQIHPETEHQKNEDH